MNNPTITNSQELKSGSFVRFRIGQKRFIGQLVHYVSGYKSTRTTLPSGHPKAEELMLHPMSQYAMGCQADEILDNLDSEFREAPLGSMLANEIK